MKMLGATATAARNSEPGQRQPGEHAVEVLRGRRAGPDAGDVAAVLAEVVRLLDRVELDRRVEVREEDDQRRLGQQVGEVAGLEVVVHELLRAREVLRDRGREREQRGREDDRDHAGHVDAQRQVGGAAGRHPAPDHPLRVLDRDPALAFLDEDDRGDDADRDEREEDALHRPAVPPGADAEREARQDRGEDEDRDAVADPALRDLLADPHEQDGAGR